jgi:acetylornithine/succinyldiaminopimelate/putrescine aminotransferase
MAGIVVPPEGYLPGLERLCRERGALLIFDEVQTGLGRLGAPTAARSFGVFPHLLTFAKGLGSGVPVAALVAAREIGPALRAGDLGSTFGGGPLACAAALATLETIQRERLWENAARMEGLLRERLRFPAVREIRGRGLLLGLVFDRPAKLVRDALLARGVLTGTSEDSHVLRLLPPLTIGPAEVGTLADALRAALA